MPAANRKLCQCNVCGKRVVLDEDTNEEIFGQYLTPYEHGKHRKAQLQRLHNYRDGEEEEDEGVSNMTQQFLATTLESRDLSDATVTRQDRHPGDESRSASGWNSKNLPTNPSRRSSSSDSEDEENQSSPAFPLSNPTLDQLSDYKTKFLLLKSKFSTLNLNLTFKDDPITANEPLPRLTYTSKQRSSNQTYLDHQQKIRSLLDDVDALDVTRIADANVRDLVRQTRKRLVRDLQEYCDILESLAEQQWLLRKKDCGLIARSGLVHFDTGEWKPPSVGDVPHSTQSLSGSFPKQNKERSGAASGIPFHRSNSLHSSRSIKSE